MLYQYTIALAGQLVHCSFQYPQNVRQCKDFILYPYGGTNAVSVTELERRIFMDSYPEEPWNHFAERKTIIGLVSDKLLPSNRLIFHSVAFLWRGKAWLITAPSGTGKTTQYRNLKELYGDEIQIICGDNPVLHFQADGVIMVHPSPWNGKENYGGEKAAPLAGIVWLEQKHKDKMERLAPKNAVIPIFHEINTYSRTPELVDMLFELEEKMITSLPVWKFENTGTLASSRMLLRCLADYEERERCDGL